MITYASKDWILKETNFFWKTKERNGFLSNMCAGYPLTFLTSISHKKVIFHTSEALYQAARFPTEPSIQEDIANERNPMEGKFISRANDAFTRPDWFEIRVSVMRWVIYQKWYQHSSFRDQILALSDLPIVEYSTKDDFWGAKPIHEGVVRGANILGQLLEECRNFSLNLPNKELIFRGANWKDPLFFGEILTEYKDSRDD